MTAAAFATWVQDVGFPMAALVLSASHTGETSVTLSLDTSTDLAAIVRAAIR